MFKGLIKRKMLVYTPIPPTYTNALQLLQMDNGR